MQHIQIVSHLNCFTDKCFGKKRQFTKYRNMQFCFKVTKFCITLRGALSAENKLIMLNGVF